MVTLASWASEAPAVNHTAFLEIEDAKSARDALDSNELREDGGNGFDAAGVLLPRESVGEALMRQ